MGYILVPFLLEASAAKLAVVITGNLTKYFKKNNITCPIKYVLEDRVDWTKFLFPYSSYSVDIPYIMKRLKTKILRKIV